MGFHGSVAFRCETRPAGPAGLAAAAGQASGALPGPAGLTRLHRVHGALPLVAACSNHGAAPYLPWHPGANAGSA